MILLTLSVLFIVQNIDIKTTNGGTILYVGKLKFLLVLLKPEY
jgi:hypothetical protein